jgi:hypothetical protein
MYKFAAFVLVLVLTVDTGAYEYDPNDFATEVVEYVPGTMPATLVDVFDGIPFTYPWPPYNTVLGRPTYVTTGDDRIGEDVDMPVVPVYGAFRWWEITSIGNGGRLVVKFNHPVANDRNNLYGIDFIIFGNAQQGIIPQPDTDPNWTADSDPNRVTVSSSTSYERGIVSVSKDGQNWYTFTGGPYADDFAPTAGYKWDYANHCWGEELDPTRPADPNLDRFDVYKKTVAKMIDMYDGAAGGTGFDIGRLGLDWIQYVKIEDDPALSEPTTEIDAISDASACGDYKHPFPIGDLNEDCRVNLKDFVIMAQQWVDVALLEEIAAHWLECVWDCQ